MTLKERIIFLLFVLILAGSVTYYALFFTPKNSLELYQQLAFSDSFEDVGKLFLDGYENNFIDEDVTYIQESIANRVEQFTQFEYDEKSFVIMSSPGTKQLKILAIEEWPADVRTFFLELLL